jgi:hypothetical protein
MPVVILRDICMETVHVIGIAVRGNPNLVCSFKVP